MKKIINLIILVAIQLSFIDCDNNMQKETVVELKINREQKIDSIIGLNVFRSKTRIINDTSLEINLLISEPESVHFRRRGFIADYSIYLIRNELDKINFIKIRELVDNKTSKTELIDSINYIKSSLKIIKSWETKDPIYLYLMTKMLAIDNKKYEDLKTIADNLVIESKDPELKGVFDPDFTYFLDKYINEIYGEKKGVRYREYMEYFYYYSHDNIGLKYIKPVDVKYFLDYGDSIYYSKMYLKELNSILENRKAIPKEWPPLSKEI